MRAYLGSLVALAILFAAVGCSEPTAEAPKADAPKTDAPKAEEPKVEAPKTEAPKTEAPAAGTTVSFTKDLKPMTDKFCLPCHGENGKGGLSLTYKDDAAAVADKAKFAKAVAEIESKAMPPAKHANQPTDADRAAMVKAFKGI